MQVIIADDETIIRAGLEKILTRMDMDIQIIGSYSNGFDALTHINRLADHEIDVLITDIKMPKMNGLKLMEAVADRTFSKIIFSGFSEFEYARKAIRCGVSDYLLKPIDKVQLNEVFRKLQKNITKPMIQISSTVDQADEAVGHHAVIQIKTILLEQFDRNFELDLLAEQVDMSPHYISRLFKQITGETITDYLIDIRIEKAKQYLIDFPQMKNYEIAQAVGYSDGVYFQKIFKKLTGYTPREYKELSRK